MQDFIMDNIEYILAVFGYLTLMFLVFTIKTVRETKQMYKETKEIIDRIDLKI